MLWRKATTANIQNKYAKTHMANLHFLAFLIDTKPERAILSNTPKPHTYNTMPYQISCEISSKGKRVSVSKRRVKWEFGFFAENGEDRGREHQVVLVWSISSGKQVILVDGIVVHFARTGQFKLECSWEKFGHTMKIVAHASPPIFPPKGGAGSFRQYDFLIDNISWNDFPTLNKISIDTNRRMLPNLNSTSAHQITTKSDVKNSAVDPTMTASGDSSYHMSSVGGILKSKSLPDLADPTLDGIFKSDNSFSPSSVYPTSPTSVLGWMDSVVQPRKVEETTRSPKQEIITTDSITTNKNSDFTRNGGSSSSFHSTKSVPNFFSLIDEYQPSPPASLVTTSTSSSTSSTHQPPHHNHHQYIQNRQFIHGTETLQRSSSTGFLPPPAAPPQPGVQHSPALSRTMSVPTFVHDLYQQQSQQQQQRRQACHQPTSHSLAAYPRVESVPEFTHFCHYHHHHQVAEVQSPNKNISTSSSVFPVFFQRHRHPNRLSEHQKQQHNFQVRQLFSTVPVKVRIIL